MKIGDKVRFLNVVGGGTISGFQGKDVVLVRDADGFDIPTLVRECVVIEADNYNFTHQAKPAASAPAPSKKTPKPAASPSSPLRGLDDDELEEEKNDALADEREITFRPKPLERRGGEQLNLFLAFVPADAKAISATSFEAYFINDCNYNVRFTLLTHEGNAVTMRHEAEVEANTKLFLEEFTRDDLAAWERVTVQAIAYKPSKSFLPKAPVNVGLRIDLTKFYKLHTFTTTDFFSTPALLCDVVRDDRPVRSVYVEAGELQDVLTTPKSADRPLRQPARKAAADDPKKPLEVDLHAAEILETTSGLTPKDILDYQLKTFREAMEAHKKERGRKIVFIHGKGEGVLRNAILKELKRAYPHCRYQDASFREYGFGATMVTL